jgi:hypothetical protein
MRETFNNFKFSASRTRNDIFTTTYHGCKSRTFGIQQSDKKVTRSRTAQLEDQPRKMYPSDVAEYRQGQRARERDKRNKKERPLVEVLNPENEYNKGYFGNALNQLYQTDGVQPRQVKQGRPKSSVLSEADTPAPKTQNSKEETIKQYI